jgi:HD-GYP domain-containing protein (c-di-GMP phosphodiesterase class II)
LPDSVHTQKYRRISVDEIRVGMYCADVYNAQGIFVLAAHIPVSSNEQIEVLRRLGVTHVDIDITKGSNSSPSDDTAGPAAPRQTDPAALSSDAAYAGELPKAKDLYRKTIESVRNAIQGIKLGKSFSSRDIEGAVVGIVESILRNPDAMVNISSIRGYDDYLYEHSVNVTILVCALSHELGYAKDTMVEAGVGAFLHDLGMTWIPENIVNKPDKLTEVEYGVLKRHPEYGIEILKDRKGISDLSRVVVMQHHERLNGKGYPRKLKNHQVHPIGAIAGIADIYDAMTSDRVHRSAFTPQQALASLYTSIDREFPHEITEHFVKLLGVYPVGSFVQLTGGEKGIVLRVRKGRILSPDVLVLFAADGERLGVPVEYHLSRMERRPDGKLPAIDRSLNPRDFKIKVAEYVKGKIAL